MGNASGHIDVKEKNNLAVVRITTSEPDEETFAAIVEEVLQAMGGTARRVHLDLAKVTYVQSTSLGALVSLDKRLHETGSQLVLCNPSDALSELLEITGLEKVLQVETDE